MNTKSIDVLLVEDSQEDVDLMKEALSYSRLPLRLSVSSDGQEALTILKNSDSETRPDLIILDLNLPRKNGHEVLYVLKNDISLKTIPTIILTTSRSEKDIERCYFNHCNCYICKPLNFNDYFEVIQKIEKFWMEVAQLPSMKNWRGYDNQNA